MRSLALASVAVALAACGLGMPSGQSPLTDGRAAPNAGAAARSEPASFEVRYAAADISRAAWMLDLDERGGKVDPGCFNPTLFPRKSLHVALGTVKGGVLVDSEPGEYAFVERASSGWPWPRADGRYALISYSGASQDPQPRLTSGTVRMEKVASRTVTGSFDLLFESGERFTRTFDATVCWPMP